MVAEAQKGPKKVRKPKDLTGRELLFARAVATGSSQTDAYIAVYQPKTKNHASIGKLASRVGCRRHVLAEVDRLRQRSEMKALLSVDDRFRYLAKAIQDLGERAKLTASEAQALARCTGEYNSMAGDHAPTKTELTGPGGAPLQMAAVVADAGPAIRRMGVKERLAALRRERLGLPAEREAAVAAIEPGPIEVISAGAATSEAPGLSEVSLPPSEAMGASASPEAPTLSDQGESRQASAASDSAERIAES